MVSFGNPLLTLEFSNLYSLNYLRTWTAHSLLVSAYYRPTSDVMQRINWQSSTDGRMYQTTENVAHSQSSGLELTAKNKLFRFLDLSTNVNFFYYKLDGFKYVIDGQTVTGQENHNFTWNARMQASLKLPYDISVQSTFNYRSRMVISQGYRKANYGLDMGVRKNSSTRNSHCRSTAATCSTHANGRTTPAATPSHDIRKTGGRAARSTSPSPGTSAT